MFNMGFSEMIVLAVIALIVIGPKQLPEVARMLARMLNEFKRATSEVSKPIKSMQADAASFLNETKEKVKQQVKLEELENLVDLDLTEALAKKPDQTTKAENTVDPSNKKDLADSDGKNASSKKMEDGDGGKN